MIADWWTHDLTAIVVFVYGLAVTFGLTRLARRWDW